MFSKIWGTLILISVVVGTANGRLSEVMLAMTEGASNAVSFCITLVSIMALWSGIMEIAEKSGIISAFASLLSPVLNLVFKGTSGECRNSIVKNVSANMLGLGNAATPFGIDAVKQMKKGDTATNEMIRFIVLNTASLQLIPTTLISMRMAEKSAMATDIIIPVWITSVIALCAGLVFSKVGEKLWR